MGMRKIHYGWVICVTCTLLLFVTMGTVSNGFSIYLPYIMAERGLTHAQTSSLVTLRCLVAFVAMLLIGGYYRKVSLRVGPGLPCAVRGLPFGCTARRRPTRFFVWGRQCPGSAMVWAR